MQGVQLNGTGGCDDYGNRTEGTLAAYIHGDSFPIKTRGVDFNHLDEDKNGEECEGRQRDVAQCVGFDSGGEKDEQHRDQDRSQALVELEHLANCRAVATREVHADDGDCEQTGLFLDLV